MRSSSTKYNVKKVHLLAVEKNQIFNLPIKGHLSL